MTVKVKLFANLRKQRFKESDLTCEEGALLSDLLDTLKIEKKRIGILLVNGRDAKLNQKLTTGDTVSIFPAVGGG